MPNIFVSFIRIKRIQGKEYAYLVENHWQNNSSRQKVKDYLGKVIKFEKNQISYQIDTTKQIKDYILELVKKELISHGFKEDKETFTNQEISIKLDDLSFKKGSKEIVLLLNEGFLCNKTVDDLINFKIMPEENEQNVAIRLAKTILESGLKTSHEEFVSLYEKIIPQKKQEKFEIYY